MEGRLLLQNCALLQGDDVRAGVSVVVDQGLVLEVGSSAQLRALPGDWVVDGRGRLVVPGRLDGCARLATLGSVADVTAAEAIVTEALAHAVRTGVTQVVSIVPAEANRAWTDAHRQTAARVGARVVVALEPDPRAPDACLRHLASWDPSGLTRGALALPDSAQVLDASLLAAVASHHLAVVVQLGDDPTAGARVLAQLQAAGLRGPGVALVLGAALPDEASLAAIARAEALLVCDAQLALRSGAELARLGSAPVKVALGTGAASGRGLRAGAAALGARGVSLGLEGAVFASQRFGVTLGVIQQGAGADLLLLDEVPALGDSVAELERRALDATIAWTIVAGRVVVREGQLLGTDGATWASRAAAARSRVSGPRP